MSIELEGGIIGEPLMAKALLSLLLVTAQLSLWSGPALWLCICGSGQTCIVSDPQTCKCCRGHHLQGTPCCEAQTCQDDERGASGQALCEREDLHIGRSPGCPHIQLSHHQSTVVAASFAADPTGLAPFLAEAVGPAYVVASVCSGKTAVTWRSGSPIPILGVLACAVLQC
jgi:hypothetical protein